MSQGTGLVRVLFVLSCLVAGVLVLLTLLAPWLTQEAETPAGWAGRLLALFARDAAVRRISLAGAIGLAATACVFFRPTQPEPTASKTPRQASPQGRERRGTGPPCPPGAGA